MANNNAIGQFSEEVEQVAGEVAKDVKDEFGQTLEQGIQSATGTTLTPAQIQEQQQENQKKEAQRRNRLAYTRQWFKNLEQAQNKVIAENKQKEQQRLQVLQREVQVTEMKKEEEKQKVIPANAGKIEIKGGVGG